MGYSRSARASYTLDAIRDLIGAASSNAMPGGGFWEIGAERADGAIVGTVWRKLNPGELKYWAHLENVGERVTRRGSFHIRADGAIKAFPGLSASTRVLAVEKGAARYDELHIARPWRQVAVMLAEQLEGPGPEVGSPSMRARAYWKNVEAIASDYQREAGIAFLAMPAVDCGAMAEWLREIAS